MNQPRRTPWFALLLLCLTPLPASAQEAPTQAPPTQATPTQSPPTDQATPQEIPAKDNASKDDAAAEAQAPPLSAAAIQERLKTLETAGLGEVEQKRVAESYQRALELLTQAEQQREELKTITKKFETQPADANRLRQQLAEPVPPAPEVDPQADLSALERDVTELEQTVRQTGQELSKLQARPATRAARISELPSLIADAQQQLSELAENPSPAAPPEGLDPASAAQQALTQARVEALKTSIALMQKQLQYFSTDGEVLKLQQDLKARELADKERQLAKLTEIVNQRRKAETSAQVAAAARDAKKQRPAPIAALADRNAQLAKLRQEISEKLTSISETSQRTAARNLALKTEFERSQGRVETSGLSEGIGQLLRQQQANLPDLQSVKRRRALRAEEEAQAIFNQYELNDRRNELSKADLDEEIAGVLAQFPPGELSEQQRQQREQEVRELLKTEHEYLDALLGDYNAYSLNLTKLTAEEDELINRTQQYADFIAKRVLWIRSSLPLGFSDIPLAIDAAAWSLNPKQWRDAGLAVLSTVESHPSQTIFICLGIIVLLALQRRSRRLLNKIGVEAAKPFCVNYPITLRAVWLTLLTALPWPVLLWCIGWWMERPLVESEFVRSLSHGLRFTAVCLLLLEFLRQLCRSGGLADAHFEWPQACLVQVRRNLRWLTWAVLPLVLWLVGLEIQRTEPLWSSSLGRGLFIIVMLMITYVLRCILLASGSPLLIAMQQSSKSWLAMLHKIWGPTLVLLPAGLAVLAAFGYYYTALHMAVRLVQSVALIVVLMILGSLTQRWILTTRRRLARENARKRREQAAAAAAAATTDGSAAPIAEFTEEAVDLKALGAQTHQLIHTVLLVLGLVAASFIWKEMLSAVAYLGAKPIFLAEGGLTWGQLLIFGLIVTVTWAAVRDLPALLDFAILQHLPMDSGSRYAVTAVCRYLMAAFGAALAFNALDFHWDSIQWLVAAMGVGLGFGLQEIFANFVSGIILLFERPIRVGDIITLGERTGVVNRIRMRATTIVDWDRKEYIVPNKDLVTERLLNWTLTDHVNRIVIEVGVAYGSDTELACELLRQAAQEHPLIVADPPPITSFDRFGDSTLNLTLRCYLPNLENRLPTIHELHTAIDKKFRDANIEIAFPQSDLHIRSLPPGFSRLPEQTTAAASSQSNGQS